MVISIILLILFWGFVYFYFFNSEINKDSFFDRFNRDSFFDDDSENDNNKNLDGVGTDGSVGSDSSSSLVGLGSENVEEEVLPSDLYDVECGFYFEQYGVCGGICPSGNCVSEGRSCYCKI